MSMSEKNCHHLLDYLSDYLDGEASAEICAEIDQHLHNCEDCNVVVNTLRKTVDLYHTLPQTEMPERLRQRLFKSLDLKPYIKPEDT